MRRAIWSGIAFVAICLTGCATDVVQQDYDSFQVVWAEWETCREVSLDALRSGAGVDELQSLETGPVQWSAADWNFVVNQPVRQLTRDQKYAFIQIRKQENWCNKQAFQDMIEIDSRYAEHWAHLIDSSNDLVADLVADRTDVMGFITKTEFLKSSFVKRIEAVRVTRQKQANAQARERFAGALSAMGNSLSELDRGYAPSGSSSFSAPPPNTAAPSCRYNPSTGRNQTCYTVDAMGKCYAWGLGC